MEPQKRIVLVDQAPDENVRYLHTTFPVAVGRVAREVSVGEALAEEWVLMDERKKATTFIRALAEKCRNLGLVKVTISQHQITLIKYPAFEWEPIHQAAIETLVEVYEVLEGRWPKIKWSDRVPSLRLRRFSPFYIGTALSILAGFWVGVVVVAGIERTFVLASVPILLAGFVLQLLGLVRIWPR